MNLLRIKLLNKYKNFPKNSEFTFNDSKILAVVGVNGSGKSIFMEVIINIFMDIYAKLNKHKVFLNLEYEIEYSLVPNTFMYSVVLQKNSDISIEKLNEIVVKAKSGKDFFIFQIYYKNHFGELTKLNINAKEMVLFLPASLVVYSSGENETISNELLRYRLINQNKSLNRLFKQNEYEDLDDFKMKLEYVHNNYRSILILSMLLFENDKIRKLKELIKIKELHSIRIKINFQQRGINRIDLPPKEIYDIRKLIKYSGVELDETEFFDGLYELNFENKYEMINEDYLSDPKNLYRTFEYLENLNLLKISKKKRKQIENELEYSIKDLHSYYSNENKVFEIKNIVMKNNDNNFFSLSGLSDGEYQMLVIMSLLLIHDKDNTLFILDEPDTHFNPEWKAKFISLLSIMKSDNSQSIISTHNPEVLTDIKSEDIILLKEAKVSSVDLNTFGTNPNIIASNLFNKNNTISDSAKKEYDKYLNLINAEESTTELEIIGNEIMDKLGNSSERMILLNKIFKKQRK
ncbi:AAA family ATPase [Lysinibacillus xylanilyticus]|uniref:AAA family ATPase n=1 Tax=Lysinibacillus xylanilyticus TaxID=582475 RepID=A0ABT4EMZ3_9BACI|nr:AAA family ATPase [Lysinibacillus xylanilyticus]MCY9547029.1 AAA family ATPase [Lysinibacillus xylanilyticus]